MKKSTLNVIAILALLLFPLTIIAQTSITVIIKSPIKIDSVSMDDLSSTEHYNQPFKDTLTFNFRKKSIDCYNIKYYIKNKRYKNQIWLDAGNINLTAHLADTSNFIVDTVLNSPMYYHKKAFLSSIASVRKDSAVYNAMLLAEMKKYLETTWCIYVAHIYLEYNQNSKPNFLQVKEVLSNQKTDLRWFMLYQIITPRLNELLKIKKFNIADFAFINRKGNTVPVKLENYDYYLLDFWFLECPQCRRDHLWIIENVDKISAQRIQVISISTDAKKLLPEWTKYLSQHKCNWDNYLQVSNKKVTEYLGINGYPSYVLLNVHGEIVKTASTITDALQQFGLK